MKPATKIGLALIVVTAGVILGFRFWVKPPPPAESVPPSVELVESRLVGRKDGKKQWELLTRSLLQAGEEIRLDDLDDIIIFQDGEPYFYVQAEWATWWRKQDLLELNGPVIVKGEDGFRLESDQLIWHGQKGTLTSPGPVVVQWEDALIRAGQMVFEVETELIYLSEQVEIREGQFVFTLENTVYDLNQKTLEFIGGLVIKGK